MPTNTEKDFSIEAIHDILMSDCIGGDINSDMSIFDGNRVTIHCWDGRRFKLSIKVLSPGCAFDTKTGSPITGDKK